MTIAVDDFIRRFFLNVLPKGFHCIRPYDLLASTGRKANLTLARELLVASPPPGPGKAAELPDWQPSCPSCGGCMRVIEIVARETWARGWQPRGPPPPPQQAGRT